MRWELILNTADGETEEFEDGPHPFGIASGEVVVDGHDVDAEASQGIEEDRKSRDESLTLTGLHFGNHAAVKGDASDELNIEMNHFPRHFVVANIDLRPTETTGGVFNAGVGLWENLIKIFVTKDGEVVFDFSEGGLGGADVVER